MNRVVSVAIAAAMVLSMAGAVQAAGETKPKKEPTPAQAAARERMAKCSLEWKDAKAGGKLEKDANWPKFWSACNTRLKAETKAWASSFACHPGAASAEPGIHIR